MWKIPPFLLGHFPRGTMGFPHLLLCLPQFAISSPLSDEFFRGSCVLAQDSVGGTAAGSQVSAKPPSEVSRNGGSTFLDDNGKSQTKIDDLGIPWDIYILGKPELKVPLGKFRGI